jgi:dihydrofolate reductase
MQVIIIAAVAANHAIGKDNDLIWHLPDDMKFFKRTTQGKPIITGRKNYESIPAKFRPLPNRTNLIVTRNSDYKAEGAIVVQSIEEALSRIEDEPIAFIIGGGEIYKYALEHELVDKMYLTRIHEEFEADTFFPVFDDSKWDKSVLSEHAVDENHAHAFTIIEYTKK